MKNKLFISILATLIVFITIQSKADPIMANDSLIQIKVNGTKLETEIYPAIIDGRIFIPMRALFESLGAKVVWDADMGMVSAVKGEQKVTIKINSKEAWINYKKVFLERAPMIIDGHTMVPLRFISESLGEKVEWEESSRTVYIGSRTPPKPPETPKYTSQYNLQNKTSLAYRKGSSALFRPGMIYMRDKDYVKSGTLAEDSFILCNERGVEARFKGGTQVTFNEKGYVETGTLAVDLSLGYAPLDSIDPNLINRGDRNKAMFKQGTSVKFNLAGYVTEGTLAMDCPLPYSQSAFADFKGDNPIKFRTDGKVASGTLGKSLNYTYVNGETIYFEDCKPIEFYNSGSVKSAYLLEDNKLFLTSKWDQEVEFKKENRLGFFESGFVSSGVLKNNTGLPYQQAILAEFKLDTEITLYESGYVRRGTLSSATSLPSTGGNYQNYSSGSVINFDSSGKVSN